MIKTEVLVIGSGLAGCITALKAADLGLDVLLLTPKTAPDDCSTGRAQGGIIYKGEKDSKDLLINDIYEAGAKIGYMPSIKQLAELGTKCIEEVFFKRLQIPFDKDTSGEYDLTSEGAHSIPRIIHVSDFTGFKIYEHVIKAVSNHPNIKLYKDCLAIDLLTTGHSSLEPQDQYKQQCCFGVHAFNIATNKVFTVLAKETVIATGGIGGLYLHTTNPESSRGDGIAMASRAGARIVNMEYVQFHPTAIYHPSKSRLLLSESLRGEGAILINDLGKEFMHEYHPLKNLAPRDITARAIYDQMLKYKKNFVYLDISHKNPKWLKKRFPLITKICEEYGYDITKEPVPVVPAAHYSCGGILVDLKGNTNISNLRAVGEVACSGAHGANRLASTSLLECLVWGVACAEDIAAKRKENFNPPQIMKWQYEHEPMDLALIYQDWQTLRNTMWNYVGPVRSHVRLQRANSILTNLKSEVENFYDKAELSEELIGLRNGIEAATTVLQSALKNTQSIGCHYYVR